MKTGSLHRLLKPRSIAVIGGGKWCESVVGQAAASSGLGQVWPVHPSRDTIGGVPAFQRIEDVPGSPDTAFVGVNRDTTIDVIRTLSEMGAGGAVCFASGFLEADDGAELQAQLLEAAGDMPVLGPNCYGYLNYLDGACVWPDQHGGVPVKSGVAVVTQSSNIAINLTMQQRALPLAYLVAAGNQAQLDVAEIGLELLQDDRVTALGLHVEGVKDLRAFERLAEFAHRNRKPVIVLKVGGSDHAKTAVRTHTAAIAGSNAGAEALFRRLFFASVETPALFVETLKLAHMFGDLHDNTIASMSCSGGEAGLISDCAARAGLNFPSLSEQQSAELSSVLGPLVTPDNPLDYQTTIWGDTQALTNAIGIMCDMPVSLLILILDLPRSDRCDPSAWDHAIEAVLAANRSVSTPLAVVSTMPENMPEAVACHLMENGVAALCGLEEACLAIRCSVATSIESIPEPIVLGSAPVNPAVLGEDAAKAEFKAHGFPLARFLVTGNVESAVEAAETIGFPVALKGTGFAHKSEHGAVCLNLDSAEAVRNAALTITGAKGFLVEEMIADTVAELLVGVQRDPAHGFVLTIGTGGVETEIWRDQQSLLVPSSSSEIGAALDRLKITPILRGYRGGPKADQTAIISFIEALQTYVASNADTLELLEINPLMCGTDGVKIADALISREMKHE